MRTAAKDHNMTTNPGPDMEARPEYGEGIAVANKNSNTPVTGRPAIKIQNVTLALRLRLDLKTAWNTQNAAMTMGRVASIRNSSMW